MKFKEIFGIMITKIGLAIARFGAQVAHAGFDLSNVSRERVVEVMTKMWAEDIKKQSQIVTSDDILEKEHYGTFVRATARTEERQ